MTEHQHNQKYNSIKSHLVVKEKKRIAKLNIRDLIAETEEFTREYLMRIYLRGYGESIEELITKEINQWKKN